MGRTLLRTQISYRFGIPLIYLSGELDQYSAGELRAVIQQEIAIGEESAVGEEPAIGEESAVGEKPAIGVKGLILECSELTYVDSAGLSVLFETVQLLENRGRLTLVGLQAGVRKLMEMTGLVGRPGVNVYDDLASLPTALAALKG